MQTDENTPKNPESDTFFEKLTQKSGLHRPKTDPKWRHVPVPLYRGVPPPGPDYPSPSSEARTMNDADTDWQLRGFKTGFFVLCRD